MKRRMQIESVWDYPRPPIVVPDDRHVLIEHAGRTIVDTTDAVRVLETSHPPTFYVPLSAVTDGVLRPSSTTTYCEFKGQASYWDLLVGDGVVDDAAWGYPYPHSGYEALAERVSFYPAALAHISVGGEPVRPQEGGFYGGWITSEIEGPFKGAPGTRGW